MAITRLSTTANAGVGTYTITKPTVAVGDVLVATFVASSGSPAVPSGWTSIGTFNYSTSLNGLAAYRVVDGTEGSSFNFAGTGTAIWGHMVRYSGADTSSVIDGTPTTVNTNASDTMTPASITTTVDGSVLVLAGFGYATASDGTGMAPSGSMAEALESNFSNAYFLATADETIATAGATGTRSYTLSSPGATDITIGIMFAVKNQSGTDATATTSRSTIEFTGGASTATAVINATATTSTTTVDYTGGLSTATGQQNATATTSTTTVAFTGGSSTATGQWNATATTSTTTVDYTGGVGAATGTSDGTATTSTTTIAFTGGESTATAVANATATTSTTTVSFTGGESTATGQQNATATTSTTTITFTGGEGGASVVLINYPWDDGHIVTVSSTRYPRSATSADDGPYTQSTVDADQPMSATSSVGGPRTRSTRSGSRPRTNND